MPKRQQVPEALAETPAIEPKKTKAAAKPATAAAKTPAATHKRTASAATSSAAKAKPRTSKTSLETADLVASTVPVLPESSEPEVKEPVAQPARPSHEQIAVLAYSFYVARGYQHGSAFEDWIRAEQELMKLA